ILAKKDVFVQVTEPGGKTGWVHERYLIQDEPDNTQILVLKDKNESLEKKVAQLEARVATNTPASAEETKQLEQQLNSERLRVGELQAQLADIKSKIPAGSNAALREEINQLRTANEELVQQQALIDTNDSKSLSNVMPETNKWKMRMSLIVVVFIFGILLGVYLLDLYNRRRHGGFRV
ncbi:MAG: hypothetical protein AAF410_05840, partial [Pseudomonadota bacterium]